MKNRRQTFIDRAAELIVAFSSLVVIALMAGGGCDGGGHGGPSVTPTPQPTGFPPECEGTFDVDLSCPAESLAGSVCLPYTCDIFDDSTSPAVEIDSITVVFGDHCTATDCFTIECQNIFNGSVFDADSATLVVEDVNGFVVGEDVEGEIEFGLPAGRITIEGEEFPFACDGIIVP
ncbi:MAG TPA: hypothetical protein VHC46_00865 [Thermodesulfobacteriota bacterium]|nr:hypothetical protein [Thermodesulfobacteriota bacterium]